MSAADALSPLKRALVEIRDLRGRLADTERRAGEPIAVVGMGLRFPGGAHDPESFWELLWSGTDAITEVPPERWPINELYDPDPDAPGKMATRHGGFLADVDGFDAAFFGISPREAESMDPQQRLLLEVTWEALEHAGIPADRLFGTNAGVFLGITNSDYFRLLLADPEQIDTYTTTGNALSVAAGRLSYVLGAQGPAVSLDTACSSSLVAVHLAVQALRSGESDLALAGGVNLILSPELTINFSQARMLASDGRCKTFDAGADGYVRSEGCGMVVLKRLGDAEADGDTVLAVIRGSAVTQDGRSGGLTAPNGPSQENVIRAALASAGIAPEAVGYVEAHGTGTPLGDPIEVRALGAVLTKGRPAQQPLLLGSVKTNVGHMEAAAGIGGIIKVVLMLRHGAVPPHLHLTELNEHIAAERLAIAVPTEATSWPSPPDGRVAGVSSFGLSGTNAHIILTEAPAPPPAGARAVDRPVRVLAVSARSAAALRDRAAELAAHLTQHPDQTLADVAFSANTGRSHFAHRLAVVATDAGDAGRRHDAVVAGDVDAAVTGVAPAGDPDVAFLFTGHGSHYAGMGRQLYAEQPVFRAAIDRCAELLAGQVDRPLTTILFEPGDLLDSMVYAQPALFALQYALAELWQSWGVRPTMVAGHSAGEYVAAVVAGVIGLADGLRVIVARGRLMQSLPDGGEMVAVFLAEPEVAAAVQRRGSDVGIAAVNGPTTTVISGQADAVQAVLADLELDPDEWRHLDISVAAHSPLVEPILPEFEAVVRSATLSPPRIGLVSSMTGTLADEDLTTADYWRRHLRQPVRFADVFDTLRLAGCRTFVEIGPHPTLLALGQRCWPDADATWAPSLRRDEDESTQIATGLSMVYAAGVTVAWDRVDGDADHRRVSLPTYPWQRESYWSPAARRHHRPASVPAWPAIVAAAEREAERGPLDLQVERYPARWALLDRLAMASIVAALRAMELFATAGERVELRDLVESGRVAPGYEQLVDRWIDHLVDDGLLRRDGGAVVADQPLPETDLVAVLAEAAATFDGIEPLLDYVRRCAPSLAAVVSGEESALATLFPDGSYETVDFLYRDWAVARYFNAIVRASVAAGAGDARRSDVRVLEIGAGTGGTTSSVLPALPPERTSYTFSDVSDFFLARAAERFADHPFVGYAKLDIEHPPEDQGYRAGTYDIVIAANVLHATRDLDVTLGHVRSLLAPGGVLVAYEGTNHPRWFDVTTGLIEGWQLFEDDWREDHPLLSPARWSEALGAAGFADVVSVPAADSPSTIFGQTVLLARAPGDSTSAPRVEGGPARAFDAPARVAVPVADGVMTALADALDDERHDVLVAFVRRAVAHVLRITDVERLSRDQPLLDLGFDSLMAIELRNVLREGLELSAKLPATLVFDHPNIAAIATYLDRTFLADDQPADERTGPASPSVSATDVAQMSDDEVEALLMQKLGELAGP